MSLTRPNTLVSPVAWATRAASGCARDHSLTAGRGRFAALPGRHGGCLWSGVREEERAGAAGETGGSADHPNAAHYAEWVIVRRRAQLSPGGFVGLVHVPCASYRQPPARQLEDLIYRGDSE